MDLEDLDVEFSGGSFRDLTNFIYSKISGCSPREFAYLHRRVKREHVRKIISQYAGSYGWKFWLQFRAHRLDPLLGRREGDVFSPYYRRKQKTSRSHTIRG